MAKTLEPNMFDKILSSGPTQYFFHREEDGEVELIFTSPISVTEPGEEDLVGRVWNPPITDAQGNPLIEQFGANKGNPRQPWAKVEAKCLINGVEKIYAFGA